MLTFADSLLAVAPKAAKEWHPTRNGALRPDQVHSGTARRVWWRCPNGPDHEWQASVVNRTRPSKKPGGDGCPCCAGRRLSVTNALATRAPDVAAEWHPTKNRPATPQTTLAGSGQAAWWKCAKGHEWRATLCCRVNRGTGCPYCSGMRFTLVHSLAVLSPAIAAEWHPTRNGALLPRQISNANSRRVWWMCPEGPDHEWESAVFMRTLSGRKCPFCAGRRVSVTNSLATRAPEVAAEWHPTKNRPATPRTTYAGALRKAWWRCPKGHEWQAMVNARVNRATGCPYCSGNRVTLVRSLAVLEPAIAAEWHITRNGELLPRQVSVGSGRRSWWKCSRDGAHEWQTAVNKRTGSARSGCPFCSNRRTSATNSLAVRFPDVAREWHPTKNEALRPEDVASSTHRYAWWRCASGHVWRAAIRQRTEVGTGCMRCFRRQQKLDAAARKRARA